MTQRDRTYQLKFVGGLIITGLLVGTSGNCAFAHSNIEPDRTLGSQRSIVKPNVNINGIPSDRISGGARRGANLFHSFREFNINEGRGAYFTNPAGVENILSRVTGTNPSNILGRLGVLGKANLFLINPNGIIFGQNASLNVQGSFVASTANSLSFADGTQFSTNDPKAEPLLTVSVPTGLQFGDNPGMIRVQRELDLSLSQAINQIGGLLSRLYERSDPQFDSEAFVKEAAGTLQQLLGNLPNNPGLQVLPGRTLALVGGDMVLESGILTAAGNQKFPGGRIELGSVSGNGRVSLNPTINGLTLGYEGVSNFGNINLSQQSLLNISGAASGDVRIQGGRVTFRDSLITAATNSDNGGKIFIQSQQLNLNERSGIGAIALDGGKSNDVTLETGSLTVQDAFIGSFSSGQGQTGNLKVEATDITLIRTAANLVLPTGLFAVTGGIQQGGDLTIQTSQLTVKDGAQIAVSNAGDGQGGRAFINASDIQLIGESVSGEFTSGIFGSSFGSGRAGDLNIETERLTLQEGANIAAATRNGPGGTVIVRASDFVKVMGTAANGFPSDISGNTLGTGAAGDVQIIETDQLIVRDGGEITAEARGELGTGAAGNITIHARTIFLDNQGTITTNTRSGEFGNIKLTSQLLLLRHGSQITTDATQGTATGGNIDINSQVIIAVPLEDSNITANAVRGRGGNVDIDDAQGIFGIEFRESRTPLSDITVSSEFGVAGNVQIDAPDTDPSRRVVNLPTLTVEAEIVQACNPSDTQQSEFVITGRGGLPPSASEAIATDAIGIDWGTLNPQQSTSTEVRETSLAPEAQENAQSPDEQSIIEAQGWVVGSDGKVILTAQAPTVTPHIPWLPNDSCQGS
ncbi:MAG: filamentous hemagglutinin N-terminal domain-containing protein [Hydrococcus sp. RU_2_2]|nr:filamentous hemagglutinin N-terminal domain-containing protein [Hydrococcus sp. RU_2_2]NJP20857.1 filamentous hemagglutinin N-terminal domain-containing protein [Hydrococcus sp. CRU_1_1]